MGIREDILIELGENELTIKELSENIKAKEESTRAIINRMKNKYIEETGDYRNKYKIYRLIENRPKLNNGIVRDLKKIYKTYNTFFKQVTNKIASDKNLSLEDYITLVNVSKIRTKINQLNQKLKAMN